MSRIVKRYKAGDLTSRVLAWVQAVVFLVAGYFWATSSNYPSKSVDIYLMFLLPTLGTAAIQSIRQEKIGVDFGLFFDWFMVNIFIQLVFAVVSLLLFLVFCPLL